MNFEWDYETKRFIPPKKKPVDNDKYKPPEDDIVETNTAEHYVKIKIEGVDNK